MKNQRTDRQLLEQLVAKTEQIDTRLGKLETGQEKFEVGQVNLQVDMTVIKDTQRQHTELLDSLGRQTAKNTGLLQEVIIKTDKLDQERVVMVKRQDRLEKMLTTRHA